VINTEKQKKNIYAKINYSISEFFTGNMLPVLSRERGGMDILPKWLVNVIKQ